MTRRGAPGRAGVVGDGDSRALHPAQAAVVRPDHAILGLIAAVGLKAAFDRLPETFHVIGMDKPKRQVAAQSVGGVPFDAGQGFHPFTDEDSVLGDVPFELAEARGVHRQLDTPLVQAGLALGLDGLGVMHQHVAGERRQVLERQLLRLRVRCMGFGVADRQHADRFAARRPDRRPGVEPHIDLVQLTPQGGKAGVVGDVGAEHGARTTDHQVGQAARARVFTIRYADPRLVPETVLVDEDDSRAGRPQHQRRRARYAVESAVRSAVEGIQGPQRPDADGFEKSGGL